METRSKSRRAGIDRFSSLPDIVAHKVLSFLEMEDISRPSAVSKRCRQLCISAPSLFFDVIPYRTDARKRARLMNYLERLLILRKGMDTQDCCIRWCLESSFNFAEEEYRVLSWLHNAVICNFRRLDLYVNLKSGSDFVFPFSLFCSKSLESLMMWFTNRTGILQIPSSIGGTFGFSSLECLRMTSVRINNSIDEFVSSYCKSLEHLFLHDIRGIERITINSSSLKVLVVQFTDDLVHLHVTAAELAHLGLFWTANLPNNCELQFSAPKLGSFDCVAWHLTKPKPSFDKNLVPVLRAVAGNIKCLILTEDSMQELCKLGCKPILFPNLETLCTFIEHARDDLVPIVASFLQGMPQLNELFVGRFTTLCSATLMVYAYNIISFLEYNVSVHSDHFLDESADILVGAVVNETSGTKGITRCLVFAKFEVCRYRADHESRKERIKAGKVLSKDCGSFAEDDRLL